MTSEKIKIRQSNMETLRLISIYFIVLYHLLMWFVHRFPENKPYMTLWLPLHVGVICFILISGYFGIKPSLKGFCHLLGVFFIFSLPEIIYSIVHASSIDTTIDACLFVTKSHYWFVRTYITLYLLSPLLNVFNQGSTLNQKKLMLLSLGVISIYAGNIINYPIYADGKNVVNFLFLYQIGYFLKLYSEKWSNVHFWKVLSAYCLLNCVVCIMYYLTSDTNFGQVIWQLSFPYNSPILIINSILLFLVFAKLQFSSPFVNNLAKGVFAVYILSCNLPYAQKAQMYIVRWIYQYLSGVPFLFLLALFAFLIVGGCIGIYWLFRPLWRNLDNLTNKL